MPRPLRLADQLARRNPGIDCLRGVSIILALIHHTALRIPLARTGLAAILPRPLLMGLSWHGYEAVFVFFVVSGFLITRNAIERRGFLRSPDLAGFYARRAARILPCLLVLVAILALLARLHVPDYTILRPGQSLGGAIRSALLFHLNGYEGRTGYLPGGWDILWSLSIEEAFYLGFPLLWLALRPSPPARALVFAALALSLPLFLASLAHAPEIWREKAYLPGMAAIAAGVSAALLVTRIPRPRHPVLPPLLGWSALAGLLALFWWEPAFDRLLGSGTMLVLTLGTATLLVAFQWGWGATAARRGTAWLRSFGLLSYEIYLTHMFVVFPVVALFRRSGAALATGWLWFPPVLLLSWLLGRTVDRLLSRPADVFLRRRFATRDRTAALPDAAA